MKTLPVKVLGAEVTFAALVGPENELYEETYTATDPTIEQLKDEKGNPVVNDHGDPVLVTVASIARPATKADVQAFAAEFDPLAVERDAKATPVPKEKPDPVAAYHDPVTGDKLTKKQAEDAFKDAFPTEEETP